MLQFSVPPSGNKHNFLLTVISDSVVGLDTTFGFEIILRED